MFTDDIAFVNFEDDCDKLKQIVEIDWLCIYDWMIKKKKIEKSILT